MSQFTLSLYKNRTLSLGLGSKYVEQILELTAQEGSHPAVHIGE